MKLSDTLKTQADFALKVADLVEENPALAELDTTLTISDRQAILCFWPSTAAKQALGAIPTQAGWVKRRSGMHFDYHAKSETGVTLIIAQAEVAPTERESDTVPADYFTK